VGASFEQIDVLMDTNQSRFLIQSFECASCVNSNVYDYRDESGSTFERIPDSNSRIDGIQYSTTGFYATDTVCGGRTNDQCLTDF
jgi:hypothetical protein